MTSIPNPSLNLLNRKIAFSTLVQYGGKVLQLLFSMISLKLISGYLSESGFALYGSITEFALFFSVIGNLGIFGNLVRLMADSPRDGKVFTQALLLRLVTGGFFYVIAVALLLSIRADLAFLYGSLLFLSALFFDYVTSVCDAMLQANYLMGRATAAVVLGRAINAILIFITIRLATDLPVYLFFSITMLGSAVTAILSLFLVRQKISFDWHWDNKLIKKILFMSVPFGLINIVNNLYFRFLPDYFAHLHLEDAVFSSFNVSFRIAQVLSLASTFLMFSVLPGLKQYIDSKHWQKAARLSRQISLILFGAGLVIFLVGSLFGAQIIELLTHKKYFLDEYWFVFPMMLFLTAISYGYDLVLITLFALQEEIWFLKKELMALLVGLCFFLSTNLVVSTQLQTVLILLGAITAEFFMVFFGYLRLRHKFQQHQQEVI